MELKIVKNSDYKGVLVNNNKKKALGKGMERLMQIYQSQSEQKNESAPTTLQRDPDYIPDCPILDIHPNKDQPRKTFSEEYLEELTQSIKTNGLLQPILTRKISDKYYEIVAGERRWRAAQRAGLKELPIFVKSLTDKDVLILSLIENVQRQDLTPIEEAKAYSLMIEDFNLTQNEISEAVSKSRATIANAIRLLKLPQEVQSLLNQFQITTGHAKILLSLDSGEEMIYFANRVVDENLSVRALEKEIKLSKEPGAVKMKPITPKNTDEQVVKSIETISQKWQTRFNTNVKIAHKENKGKIFIEYKSLDELESLTNLLFQE
ncbi:ParB/RepB/Spo0J family partition protein [bacterium]|nr:ParB/RepB/Spo0J family partition protein [bacterium]